MSNNFERNLEEKEKRRGVHAFMPVNTEEEKKGEEKVETELEQIQEETHASIEEEPVEVNGLSIKLDIKVKKEEKEKKKGKAFWLKEDTIKGIKKLAKQVGQSDSQLVQEILENVLKQNSIK